MITLPDPYSIFAQVKSCLLCARVLTPYEIERREGAQVGICDACGDLGSKWGNAKVHLILDGEFAGMYSKADFMMSLQPETYRTIYSAGQLIRIFDESQDDEYEEWLMSPDLDDYTMVEEHAFAWPLGTVVEVWNKYRYEGTFKITQGSSKRRLERVPSEIPVGTSAHIHKDFGEREPALRYRKFLDPNWQVNLRQRVRAWLKEEPREQQFAEEGQGLPRIDGWLISPEFKNLSYEYWRRIA